MSSGSLISCFITRNFLHKSDSPINRISPYLVSHSDRIIWIFSDDEMEVAIFIFNGSQAHWLPLLCLVTLRAIVSGHHILIKFLSSAPENKAATSKMELPPVTLNAMLTASKNYNTEAPPSIIVLDTNQRDRLLQLDCDSATSDGHVADGFVSPFVGMTLPEVVRFVTETARDTVINPYSVFIADERTVADQTVLVVGSHDETRDFEVTVRMVPELLDLVAANLVIANMDVTEMRSNAEETGGVYRR